MKTKEEIYKEHRDKWLTGNIHEQEPFIYDAMEEYANQSKCNVSDDEIEIRLAISLIAATPEYRQGFETGGREMAKWMRDKITSQIKEPLPEKPRS